MRHTIWAQAHNRPQSIVSIDGVVLTDKHRVMRRGVSQLIPLRIHKTDVNKSNGYEALRLDGKTQTIHRLVMLSFDGANINEQVNHKDGIKTNNTYENLEWVDNIDNKKHAEETGLTSKRVLSSDDVTYVRSAKGMKATNASLAFMFGVSSTAISNIKNNKSYT